MKHFSQISKSTILIGFTAGLSLVVGPRPSAAQYAHFFKEAAMTPEDIEMAKNAAAALYTKAGVKVGQLAKWQNPGSGAEGIVEILEVESAGPCVTFRHTANTKAKPQISYYSRRCKNVDGEWILSAN